VRDGLNMDLRAGLNMDYEGWTKEGLCGMD